MRLWLCAAFSAALTALVVPPAAAQSGGATPAAPATQVDLELALLADATGSIDDAEILFQRQGYAEALRDPILIRAMTAGRFGRVALLYMEWADQDSQEVVVDWTVIDGEASAAAFAEKLMTTPRRAYGRNAIGSAILAGVAQIEGNAFDGDRKIIDFAGDSANSYNDVPISEARAAALAADITINGLAMLCRASGCSGRPVVYDLEEAYRTQIIGGDGAFVITADGPETFADAVRRKLFLEVSGRTPESRLAFDAPAPGAESPAAR